MSDVLTYTITPSVFGGWGGISTTPAIKVTTREDAGRVFSILEGGPFNGHKITAPDGSDQRKFHEEILGKLDRGEIVMHS